MVTHSNTGYHGYSLYYRLPWLLTLLQVTMVTHSTTGYHGYSLYYRLLWLLTLLQVTMVTSGYGHHSPMTNYGQLFCIAFSLLGIPLHMVTLGHIGKHLNTVISR